MKHIKTPTSTLSLFDYEFAYNWKIKKAYY